MRRFVPRSAVLSARRFADIFVSLALLGCVAGSPPPAGSDTSTGTPPNSTGAPTSSGTTEGDATTSASSGGGDLSSSSTSGPGTDLEPGADAIVTAFDGAHVFFSGWEDGQNLREIDVEVTFPEENLGYVGIELQLALRCPDAACDWWDRRAWLGVVHGAGTEEESVTELARFVTPYRVEGSWTRDVTAMRPVLSGAQTLRVFIDTWVGPGHANGNGWLVDAAFAFTGGLPRERAVAVVPLWSPVNVTIGDPANPVEDSVPAATIPIPSSASRVELHAFITGHGQGNLQNCAEFCPLEHGYALGEGAVQRSVWRDDCGDNPVNNQQGTWTLSRAGWCPGDVVDRWVEDVTELVTPAEDVTVAYALQTYENSCRPDAPVCMGCALGSDCEYNDSNHTAPTVLMSASLVFFEPVAGGG